MKAFNWWFRFMLKLAKAIAVGPLAIAGIIALLFAFQDKSILFWLFWVVAIFYVPAEIIDNVDNLTAYWTTRPRKAYVKT